MSRSVETLTSGYSLVYDATVDGDFSGYVQGIGGAPAEGVIDTTAPLSDAVDGFLIEQSELIPIALLQSENHKLYCKARANVGSVILVDAAPAASTVPLPSGVATSAKQDELQGAQGTGASYDPPTGGSGIFGWLSGIYKEIVSGIKLKIGGSDVSSSNPLPVQNANAAPTDRSSTITTGGAAQVAMAALSTRKGYFFQNVSSEIMWGSWIGTAAPSTAGSFPISPNGILRNTVPCETTALSIYGATTGQKFTAWEM